MSDQWLSVQAAAAALGVGEADVRRQIAEDKLPIRPGASGLEVLVAPPAAPATPTPPPAPAAAPPADVTRGTVFEAMLASEADEGESADAANPPPAAPTRGRLGRYAPLADSDVGTPIDPHEKPYRSPLLANAASSATAAPAGNPYTARAADAAGTADAAPVDELTRFQRLAGASLVIAQQRADESREQIAFARAEAHRLRKVNRLSLAGAGLALALGVIVSTGFAIDAGRAEGALRVQQGLVADARADTDHARHGVVLMKQEHATLTERLARAEADHDAARKQLEDQRARVTQAEVDKRQAETALQAALVSLYQYQPEEARSAVQRLRAEVQ